MALDPDIHPVPGHPPHDAGSPALCWQELLATALSCLAAHPFNIETVLDRLEGRA